MISLGCSEGNMGRKGWMEAVGMGRLTINDCGIRALQGLFYLF